MKCMKWVDTDSGRVKKISVSIPAEFVLWLCFLSHVISEFLIAMSLANDDGKYHDGDLHVDEGSQPLENLRSPQLAQRLRSVLWPLSLVEIQTQQLEI